MPRQLPPPDTTGASAGAAGAAGVAGELEWPASGGEGDGELKRTTGNAAAQLASASARRSSPPAAAICRRDYLTATFAVPAPDATVEAAVSAKEEPAYDYYATATTPSRYGVNVEPSVEELGVSCEHGGEVPPVEGGRGQGAGALRS